MTAHSPCSSVRRSPTWTSIGRTETVASPGEDSVGGVRLRFLLTAMFGEWCPWLSRFIADSAGPVEEAVAAAVDVLVSGQVGPVRSFGASSPRSFAGLVDPSFDNFIRPYHQRLRDRQPKRLGSLEIDD
jgi:hypothetical protein